MNRWLLLLILMLDAVVSRYVSGSAWHFLVVLAVAGGLELAGLWDRARKWIAAMAFPIAAAAALFGWLAFQKGLVIALFTPLPWSFHAALGIHLWAWIVSRWDTEEKSSALPPAMVFVAGALVARVPAVEEIYGAAPWMVRALGMAALVMSAWVAFASWASLGISGEAGATATPGGGARGRKIRDGVIGVAASALLLAVLLPPAESLASVLYRWYGDRGEVTRLKSFDAEGAAVTSGAGMTDGAGRRLPSEANIILDQTVRFFVEWGSDEAFAKIMRRPVYLRAMTLPVFLSDGELAPLRQGEWRYDSDDGQEDGRIRLTDSVPNEVAAGGSGREFRYSILMDRRGMRALPLVASPEQIDLTGCYLFADAWYQLALEEEQDRVCFSARSREVRLEDLAGRLPSRPGSPPNAEYVAIPGSPLAGRIGSWLARNGISREKGTLEEQLNAIRRLLAEQCAYRLRFANPEGRSPIDNFLFGEKAGHCELFASATVLILRTLGIPSRVAYGFSGGVARPRARTVAYRESDFHAWAEVFLQEHGWVVFDTAPPARAAARPPSRSGSGAAFAGFDRKAFENLSGEFEWQPAQRGLLRIWLSRLLEWMAEFIAWICAALVAAVYLVVRWRNRNIRNETGAAEAGGWRSRWGTVGKIPGFLSEYLETCAEIGRPKSAGETFLEFLGSMKRKGFCESEFDEMIRYVYRVRYEGKKRDSTAEKRFREVVRNFRKSAGRQPQTDAGQI
jgi:hypothetical protein